MKKIFKSKIVKILLIIIVVFAIWVAFNREKATQLVVDFGMWATSSKQHRDPSAEKAKFEMTADALSKAFKDNATEANKTYINQAVLLEGNIVSVSGVTITINNIACNVDSSEIAKLPTLKVGDKVKLQGLVVTYNDLMDEVDLAQCKLK